MWIPSFPIANVILAFRHSNLPGQIIVAILFGGSILAWSVMLTKWRDLRHGIRVSRRFLVAYRAEPDPVALFIRRQRYEGSPVQEVYQRACGALGAAVDARATDSGDLLAGTADKPLRLVDVQVRGVRNVAERTMADQALLLENQMGWLATAVTSAPFLGLLGTVWGVMEAFWAMSVTGSAMLSAVAPGISAALLTTVVGLLVALPSSIGYNVLTDMIRRLNVEMDNFVEEFMSDVEHRYLLQH